MEVTFNNSHGKKLSAIYEAPSGKVPCVILCHGFTSNRDDHFFPELSEALKKKGIASLRLDFTGNGKSEGTFAEGYFSQQVSDVRKAISYLKKSSKILDIGVCGHSMGASVAAMAAAQDIRVKAVALLNTAVNYRSSSKKEFFRNIIPYVFKGKFKFKYENAEGKIIEEVVDRRYAKEFRSINMFSIIQMVRPRKLFLNGTQDNQYSDEKSRKKLFEQSPGPKESKVINADHNFKGKYKELVKTIVDFFVVLV